MAFPKWLSVGVPAAGLAVQVYNSGLASSGVFSWFYFAVCCIPYLASLSMHSFRSAGPVLSFSGAFLALMGELMLRYEISRPGGGSVGSSLALVALPFVTTVVLLPVGLMMGLIIYWFGMRTPTEKR